MTTVLKDKTVLLRTSNDLILRNVDSIIVFDKDRIIAAENHNEYKKKRYSFHDASDSPEKIIKKNTHAHNKQLEKVGFKIIEGEQSEKEGDLKKFERMKKPEDTDTNESSSTAIDEEESFYYENENQEHDIAERTKGTITEYWNDDEIYNSLSNMIKKYLYVKGKGRIIFQLMIYGLTVLLFVGKDYFVGALSLHVYHWKLGVYLAVIFTLWVLAEVIAMFRNNSFHSRLMENGNYLHELMVKLLFRLKLEWLISHPSARVWFKYSYDLRLIDEELNHNI